MISFPAWWPLEIKDEQPAEGMGIWESLKSTLDIQQYKPRQAEGIICKEMKDGSGHHFMLKNARTHSYERLTPQEFWIWQKMDGETTVQQLVLAYFMEYKAFAFSGILFMLERLRKRNMLNEPPYDLYSDVSAAIQNQGLLQKIAGVGRAAFTKEFTIKGLDHHLDRIHRSGGWLLFTWPVQIAFLLISIVGTYLFIRLSSDPRYQLLGWNTALQLGLLAYVPAIIHEFGHAITAKHMGCEVHRGGVMLYYGLPAAFVDTTDMWMSGKRARLAVTWAGPYTGYIIGGACSIVVYLFPDIPTHYSIFILQIALAALFGNTLNLLPLLKLDGYYLAADALEIPRLRERSMDFIAHHLPKKMKSHEKWSRDEKIFLVFGVLAFLSTFYYTYASIKFWDKQASKSISELLNLQGDFLAHVIDAFITLIAVSFVVFILAFLVRAGRQLVNWLRMKGIFSTRTRASFAILSGALVFTLLPRMLLPTLSGWIILLSGITAFALAAWMAASSFLAMRSSVHAGMWFVAALGLFAGTASFIGEINSDFAEAGLGLQVAGIFLSLLSFLFARRLLRGLHGSWREISLVLVVLGIMAWVISLVSILEVRTFAALLIVGGLIHWRMRPATQREPQAEGELTGTREQMMDAFNLIRKTILNELELDFGKQTRAWVEDGTYRPDRSSVGSAEFSRTVTGMTPNDYGSALALSLEELLASVERVGGRKFAWRALAFGYDKLNWERQEIIEDYTLKYVQQAAGLSNQLEHIRDDLDALVRSMPLFMAMTEKEISTLCRRLKPRRVRRGDVIIHPGELTKEFCIIRMGFVEIMGDIDDARGQIPAADAMTNMQNQYSMILPVKDSMIAKLGRGDYFGEQSLLTGDESSVMVRAISPVELLTLGKYSFNRLVRRFIQQRQQPQKVSGRLRLLRQAPVFSQFEGLDLKFLASKLERVKVREGQAIFRQGDQGDCFYMIESGKVSVQVDFKEQARLGVGEYFGEIALIMNVPRTATIVAIKPTVLLKLKADDFKEMMLNSSAMKQAIERASSRRVLAMERSTRRLTAYD